MPIFNRKPKQPKTPAHLQFQDYLPPEVRSQGDPTKPAHGYYDAGSITGGDTGPGGDQGAFAIADGKSGDSKRFPLPTTGPKSVFLANGTAGIVKSMGPDSVMLDIPGTGLYHFRRSDVTELRPEEKRQSPMHRQPEPESIPLPTPEAPRQELITDLYDPKHTASVRVMRAHLVQRDGKWALVSRKDPSKVLKWFGTEKPSDEAVAAQERRVEYFKHHGASPLDGPKDMTGIRLGVLGKVRGLDVVLVDGNKVREQDVDFTMGGNPARYGYVPPGEIWVERALEDEDRAATIIHEVTEFHRMSTNGETYEQAHERAAELETMFRLGLLEDEVERVSPIDLASEFLDRTEKVGDDELDEFKDKAERKQTAGVSARVIVRAEDLPPKKTLNWKGLPIALEVVGGEVRFPNDRFPQYVPPTWGGMGYFIGLEEPDDGDSLDVIIGPEDPETHPVFLAIQTDPDDDGAFRQWKVFLGFNSAVEVEGAFRILWKAEMLGGVWSLPTKMFRKFVLPRIVKKHKQVKRVEREVARTAAFSKSALRMVAVDPTRMLPPHDVKNTSKADRLSSSMREGGWQGRPILAFMSGGTIEALTGSHRIGAARAAGLKSIPVLLIEDLDFVDDELFTMLDEAEDNYDRLRSLEKLVKSNPAAQEAYDLMLEEVREKNNAKSMSRSSSLVVTAAGLVRLKGLDHAIANKVARAIVQSMREVQFDIGNKPFSEVVERVHASLGRLTLRDLWAQDEKYLRNPEANKLFSQIRFAVVPTLSATPNALAVFSDDMNAIIVALEKFAPKRRDSIPSVASIASSLQPTLAHELRHAADWAYQEKARPGKFRQENPAVSRQDPKRTEKYINTPTELKSYAGQVASVLWNRWGPDYKKLSGVDIVQSATSIWPELMKGVTPENRQEFLSRVMSELNRMSQPKVASIRVAAKPKHCSHCKKDCPPGEFFGSEGRWLHRSCVSRGPVSAVASLRVRAQHATKKMPNLFWEDGEEHVGADQPEKPRVEFREATPQEFEHGIQQVEQSALDQERDPADAAGLYISTDGKAGYAISRDGEMKWVWSTERGYGKAAVADAIRHGAHHLSALDNGKLVPFYTGTGFKEFKREKNWTEGQPDVVFMGLPNSPLMQRKEVERDRPEAVPQAQAGPERLSPGGGGVGGGARAASSDARAPSPSAQGRSLASSLRVRAKETLETPDPVFEPGTPWHVRQTPEGLRDMWRGQPIEHGQPLTPEPSVSSKGEEQRKEVEQKLHPLLSPAQQQKLDESRKKPAPAKPEDRYVAKRVIPERSAKVLKDFGVTKDGGLGNIMNVLQHARPDEILYWQEWYKHARKDAQELAKKYDVPEQLAASLIAITSPNTQWEQNVFAAEQLLRGQGQKVIDYRSKLDEEAAENVAAKIYPELFTDKQTLGTNTYLQNIIKGQRLIDSYRASGSKEFEPDVSEPMKLSWNPYDEGERATAEKKYQELVNRGWTARQTQVKLDDKPKKSKDKNGRVVLKPPSGKYIHTWTGGESLPVGAPFPWRERKLILQPPFKGAKTPKGGKNKGKEMSPPKVTAFYNSIMHPDKNQDTVVLDGHAINLWRGEPRPLDELKENQPSESFREKMISDYKEAAKKGVALLRQRSKTLREQAKSAPDGQKEQLEAQAEALDKVKTLSPQQVQAITWTVWRDAVKNSGGKVEDADIEPDDDEEAGDEMEREASVLVRYGFRANVEPVVAEEGGMAAQNALGDESVDGGLCLRVGRAWRSSSPEQGHSPDAWVVEQVVDDEQFFGSHAQSMRLKAGGCQASVRVAKDIKTSPDTSPSNFVNSKADKAFRYDGPTYTAEGGKKKRKTPGAVNDGSQREDPSSGGAATTGPIGVTPGGGGGMSSAGSLNPRRSAAFGGFTLTRSGYRTYSGEMNGKKVKVQAEELVERGSYPANRKQQRKTVWRVLIDGENRGEAPSYREARALAYDACVTLPDGKTAGISRSSGIIQVMDTEGQEHTAYIETARPGDKAKFKRDFVGKSKGGKVEIRAGALAEVQAVNPTVPSLTVLARGTQMRGKSMKIGMHSVEVPADELYLVLPSEDTRVS